MSSATTSTSSPLTIPISPSFSSDSTSSAPQSEATSDEQPDLGAFTTVLRAWTYLQPHPRIPPSLFPSSSSSRTYRPDTASSISSFTRPGTSVATGTESTVPEVEGSTVWNQRRIQSYLDLYSGTPSLDRPEDDDELEEEYGVTELSSDAAHDNGGGYSPRSPPRSPALSLASTEDARTVEIISELDVHDTVSFDDSVSNNDQSLASGEISVAVLPLDHPQLSSDEIEGENSSLTSREVPLHYGPHIQFGNGQASPPPSLLRHVPSSSVSTFHPVSASKQSTSRQYQSTSASQHLQSQDLRSSFASDSQHSKAQFLSPFRESSAQTSQQYKSQADPNSISPSNFSILSYDVPQEFEVPPSVLNESCSLKSQSLINESHSSALTLTPEDHHHHNHSFMPTPDSGTHSLESQALSLRSQAPLDLQTRSQSHDSHSPQSNIQSVVIQPSDSFSRSQSDSPYLLEDPLSPLPTPEPEPSETFPLLPDPAQHILVGSSSHTPKRRQGIGYEPESRRHGEHRQHYSNPLTGLHSLPSANADVLTQHSITVENGASNEDIHSYDHNLHSDQEHEHDYEDGQPSLGYLDEALSFIAEERARWNAAREHGGEAGQGETGGQGGRRHVIEPRRKRRRKKPLQKEEEGTVTPSVRPLLVPASSTVLATDPETATTTATATAVLLSPGKKKKKLRLKKKSSAGSGLVSLADDRAIAGNGGNDSLLRPITILRPPAAPEMDDEEEEEEDANNGTRTPTAGGINLMGKKGKRIGRKEREREKAKKDREREKSQVDGGLPKLPGNLQDEYEFAFEFDEDDDDDDDDEDEDEDIALSSSSNSGQPAVGLKHGEKAHIHGSVTAGVYKSTPPTPGTRTPKVREPDVGGVLDESGPKHGGKKKKLRTKASKTLVHSQSFPDLKVNSTVGEGSSDMGSKGKKETKGKERKQEVTATSAAPGVSEQDKRSRLIALARKLQELFPEQEVDLNRVANRLENRARGRSGAQENKSVAGSSNGKRSKSHARTESVDVELPEGGEDQMKEPDESEELDPRGRSPRKGDTLIHVFVDHSNILIGLLSHLKRHLPPKPPGRPLPEIPKKATHTRSLSNSKSTPASAFSTVKSSSLRPLPVPIPTNGKNRPVPVPVPAPVLDSEGTDTSPIPLPSFATAGRKNVIESRSLPSGSILSAHMRNKAGGDQDEIHSDGYSTDDRGEMVVASRRPQEEPGEKEKRTPRHLWHAALVLILERGRSVTRRVIVTSSPLYQPMDGIERLGYEVRVYIRVPDLGDGMDRERHKDKDSKSGSGKSSGGGNKSVQTSPAKSSLWSANNTKKGHGLGHKRHLSGSTSAESGSGTGGKGSLKSHYASTPNLLGAATTTPAKVKYREQGVDELLQLKLHQALAATDEVPEGATIVLATGDGNVGQFNEDGFLGPVRTALRRGWKVELYAWEDGLSRSWRREFGEGSEWGRKGMFRIIGMEQFASGLVEAAGW